MDDQDGTTEAAKLRCFVVGPIGNRFAELNTSERELYEESIQTLEEIVLPACQMVGLDAVRADSLGRAGELTEQIFRRLREDDVVVADLTGANPNVMYELGMRHTRNLLTVQIGEYGRLPFDVTTIRTVQFSRSRSGLIAARNELAEILQQGLAGEYDPVTATRVWNETEEVVDLIALDQDVENSTADDDEAGFLDRLAVGEDAINSLGPITEDVTAFVTRLGEEASAAGEKVQENDQRNGGIKGRMVILAAFAKTLGMIADEMPAKG